MHQLKIGRTIVSCHMIFIGRSRCFTISAIGEHRVDRDCDLHRTVGGTSHQHGWISIERTMKVERDRDIRTTQTHLISIGRQMEVQQEPRSRRDRDPIVARLGFLRGGIEATSLPTDSEGNRLSTKLTIVARLWLFLKQKLRLICHEIDATIVINGSSRLHEQSWPSIRLHDRIKRPKNRANFPI